MAAAARAQQSAMPVVGFLGAPRLATLPRNSQGGVMLTNATLNFHRRQCNPLCFVSAIHYAGEVGSR